MEAVFMGKKLSEVMQKFPRNWILTPSKLIWDRGCESDFLFDQGMDWNYHTNTLGVAWLVIQKHIQSLMQQTYFNTW